jgi:hypothetical protein
MMVMIRYETSRKLTDKQCNVLIAAALARQFDEVENDQAGYRSIKWLTQDQRSVEADFQPLIHSGLLEIRKIVAPDDEKYFRITTAGLKLVDDF